MKKIFTYLIDYDLNELRFAIHQASGTIVSEDEFYYVVMPDNCPNSRYHILKKFVNSLGVNKDENSENAKIYQKSIVYENELSMEMKLKISKEVRKFFYKENKEELTKVIDFASEIKNTLEGYVSIPGRCN